MCGLGAHVVIIVALQARGAFRKNVYNIITHYNADGADGVVVAVAARAAAV